ncbi:MAG: hypothetical protein AAGF71_07490 [Pseudomonadota bacterium]
MRTLFPAVVSAVALGFFGPAHAQDEAQGPTASPPPRTWDVSLYAFQIGEADLDAGGNFSRSDQRLDASYSQFFNPAVGRGVSFTLERLSYDFGDLGSQGDVDINRFSFDGLISFPVGANAAGVFIPSIRYDAEAGVSFSDGVTYGALTGVAWRLSPKLTFGPGVGAFTSLDGGGQLFPFLIFDWRVTDTIEVSTRPDGRSGAGVAVRYTPSDRWDFDLSLLQRGVTFRLDDGQDSIAEDEAFVIAAQVRHHPSEDLTLAAMVGFVDDGEIKLQDEDGDTIVSSGYDTAPFVRVGIEYSF